MTSAEARKREGTLSDTSWMVVGIVVTALAFFLVFEHRSFCRYICPLSGLIGTVGSMGAVAGFRTKDREVCLTCPTKDCMRGENKGYRCPWYTWPGSVDSNLYCELCSECYKACPYGNVGLFVQRPLTSVVAPRRRRVDVAWVVAVLWGLVLYQQINATNGYTNVDDWLNWVLHFPHYPDPIAYFGVIGVLAGAMAAVAWATARLLGRHDLDLVELGRDFLSQTSRFRTFFVPMMYGLIPVVGADYFARQLPKFFKHSARLAPSVLNAFGAASTRSGLYHTRILGDPGIVVARLVVIGLRALAAVWTSWRIAGAELAPHARAPWACGSWRSAWRWPAGPPLRCSTCSCTRRPRRVR